MKQLKMIRYSGSVVQRELPCGYSFVLFKDCESDVAAWCDICRGAGVESVFLEHRESNTPASALYESFGFEKYAVRKNYYTSPVENAILRVLHL